MRRWLRSFGVAVFAAFLLMCSIARASFHILSDSVDFNSEQQTTTFDVRFSSAPDFFTLDHFGRQKDSFQYYFDRDLTGDVFDPSPDVTIIRAEEIHVANVLRIRDSLGADPSPTSGGWGPIRGAVPFTVSDDSVRFTVGWNVLGQTGDHFRYQLESYEFGTMTDSVARLIPLPSALWCGGVLLVIVVGAQIIRSRHRPA